MVIFRDKLDWHTVCLLLTHNVFVAGLPAFAGFIEGYETPQTFSCTAAEGCQLWSHQSS